MIFLNNLMIKLLSFIPKSVIWIFAKSYLAGETLEQALSKIQSLNERQFNTTLDVLGEDPVSKDECTQAVQMYKNALDGIFEQQLQSGISVKLSHLGLKIDPAFCYDNIKELAEHAKSYQRFVRIDMEDTSLKDQTLKIYYKLKKICPNIGVVSQAYLRKAIDDMNKAIQQGASVRLCKGAYYWEDESFVYKDAQVINDSYSYLMEKLLSNKCVTAIATHDEALVFQAFKLIDKYQVPTDRYEFQMLYGVQEQLRDYIQALGHPVRVYVPFGEQWYAYSIRRLKENPKMVSYVLQTGLKLFLKKIKKIIR